MITTITRAIKIIPMTATTATTPLKTPALTWNPYKRKNITSYPIWDKQF